jgi:alcohol dehydrogenase
VGIVREAGTGVFAFRPGDRVLVSCITSCGRCDYCRRSMYSHCRAGGWMLGHTIDGAQAEFVRIPHADTSLHRLPDEVGDDAALMLSDVLPTAFECGVLDGRIQPGDQVAIVGAGPIGLATVLTARFFSPSRIVVVDTDPHRLRVARSLGATHTVDAAQGCAAEEVLAISGGEGVDVAIEAVGVPETFDLCQSVVAPGGRIANIGVHGKPVRLRLDRLWSHNIGITTRLVDTACTPRLLKLVASGQLLPAELATHHFRMSETMRAYDTFASAPRERALKVILEKD